MISASICVLRVFTAKHFEGGIYFLLFRQRLKERKEGRKDSLTEAAAKITVDVKEESAVAAAATAATAATTNQQRRASNIWAGANTKDYSRRRKTNL